MSTMKKKRNKTYRPKDIVKPLGMRDASMFELPGYQASLALGQPHFAEQHVYDLLSNADMVRRIAPDGHMILPFAQDMVQACADIQHRAQETGKLGVTGDQIRVLHEGLELTLAYLRTVSNHRIIKAAREALDEFDRCGGLRV